MVNNPNPMRDYVENFRANLSAGITYDSTIGRYFCNDRRFLNEWEVERYLNYIKKFGFSAGFSPASLFASGEAGAWYKPSPTTCFTDISGTVAASLGDSVAYLEDLSGNGNHATQATASARPVLRQTVGGKYYLEFDGVDDGLDVALVLSGSRWTGGMAYAPNGRDFLLFSRPAAPNPWVGVGQNGSTSTALTPPGITQNALYFDNTPSTATNRDGQYNLAQSASTVLVDFNVAVWTSVRIGMYNAGSFTTPGDIYGLVLVERELTEGERASLQTYFEGILS